MKLPPAIRNIITKLLTEHFRYVLLGVAFVILLLGYVLLLNPQIQNVQQQGVGQLQEVEQRLEQRAQYLARLENMVKAYREVVNQQGIQVNDVLPSSPEIGKLFITLEQLLQDVGLTLDSVAVTKGSSLGAATAGTGTTAAKTTASTTATIQVLDVNISIGGRIDYEVFKKLLKNFERSIRIMDIPAISFVPAGEVDLSQPVAQGADSSISLELKTYYLEQTQPK